MLGVSAGGVAGGAGGAGASMVGVVATGGASSVAGTAFSNFLVVPWEPKPGAQMRRFNEKMTHPKFQVHRTSLDKRGG